MSINRHKVQSRSRALAVCGGVLISGSLFAGCAAPGEEDDLSFSTTDQEITAVAGDPLPGVTAADFAEARDAFNAVEALEDGLGPIFNEHGCGVCHTQGAIGGAGVQIERRFGRVVNGIFDDMADKGGSLRQLFTVGAFTGLGGQKCNVPLEVEPTGATVHNVGRLTTPLFGLGLVESIPESVIAANAAAQPASIRGIVSKVTVLLPNPEDASQSVGSVRTGRFGWKAGIATIAQFAGDAYLNEMGISTQSCSKGTSVLAFATESKPNGVAVPAGCDDLAPPPPAGVPAGVDDAVGSCAGGLNELQEDLELFTRFMTFLAPAPRLPIDPLVNLAGGTAFNKAGCAGCHLLKDYVTPANPANGVPGNFTFRPRSDFLLHDMGSLGDGIGNKGQTVAQTRLMRTAPLWGLHHRTKLLHDGRASTIEQAIAAHDGQAAASRAAFNALSPGEKSAMLAAMKSD